MKDLDSFRSDNHKRAEEHYGAKVVERRVKARAKVRAMARKEFTASMARTARGKEIL